MALGRALTLSFEVALESRGELPRLDRAVQAQLQSTERET